MSDCRTPYINIHFEEARPLGAFYYEFIRVGRGGGPGGAGPPNNLRGGTNIPFGPPNNPPTFSFNFYVKQEKITNVQVEGYNIIINATLI